MGNSLTMPRCEKCGYPRATIEWCTSCGSSNPYPVRKRVLRSCYIAALVLTFLFGTFFARQAALERIAREKQNAGSFRAQRESRPIDMPFSQR